MYKCFADWNDVGNIEIISNYIGLNKIKPSFICGITENVMIINLYSIIRIVNNGNRTHSKSPDIHMLIYLFFFFFFLCYTRCYDTDNHHHLMMVKVQDLLATF